MDSPCICWECQFLLDRRPPILDGTVNICEVEPRNPRRLSNSDCGWELLFERLSDSISPSAGPAFGINEPDPAKWHPQKAGYSATMLRW